jgi:acetyl-CoA acyltransferase
MRQQVGREVVIVEAARTPIGRGKPDTGYYAAVHPNELLGACYSAVIERAGIPAELVEDVVAGCVTQVGEQSQNIARNAWLQAGLPVTTPATTVDRQCGSAQQAVNFAAAQIAAGVHEVVIGAGVEHMGHVPMGANTAHAEETGVPFPSELLDRYELIPQGIERRADRGALGDPALGARRVRRALSAARGEGHRRGALRAGDSADARERLDVRERPRHPS